MNRSQTFTQVAPAQTWTINHSFTGVPISDVVTVVLGQAVKILPLSVKAVSATQLLIEFSEPYAGVARLYGNVLDAPPVPGSGGIDLPIVYPEAGRLFWYDTFTAGSNEIGPAHIAEVGGGYAAFTDVIANTGGLVVSADGTFRVNGELYGDIALTAFTAGPSRWDEAPYRLTVIMNQMFADGIDFETTNQSWTFSVQDGPDENEYAIYASMARSTTGITLYVQTPGGTYFVNEIDPSTYLSGQTTFEITYFPLTARTVVMMNGDTHIDELGLHTPLTLDMEYLFLRLYDNLENGWGITSGRFEQLTTPAVDYGTDGPGPGGYQESPPPPPPLPELRFFDNYTGAAGPIAAHDPEIVYLDSLSNSAFTSYTGTGALDGAGNVEFATGDTISIQAPTADVRPSANGYWFETQNAFGDTGAGIQIAGRLASFEFNLLIAASTFSGGPPDPDSVYLQYGPSLVNSIGPVPYTSINTPFIYLEITPTYQQIWIDGSVVGESYVPLTFSNGIFPSTQLTFSGFGVATTNTIDYIDAGENAPLLGFPFRDEFNGTGSIDQRIAAPNAHTWRQKFDNLAAGVDLTLDGSTASVTGPDTGDSAVSEAFSSMALTNELAGVGAEGFHIGFQMVDVPELNVPPSSSNGYVRFGIVQDLITKTAVATVSATRIDANTLRFTMDVNGETSVYDADPSTLPFPLQVRMFVYEDTSTYNLKLDNVDVLTDTFTPFIFPSNTTARILLEMLGSANTGAFRIGSAYIEATGA